MLYKYDGRLDGPLLYHYSGIKLEEIYSLAGLNKEAKGTGSNQSGRYVDSVSFFLDPIPRNVAKILNGESERWVSGDVYYEHIVYTSALPKNIRYMIMESYERTKFIYETMTEKDWDLIEEREERFKDTSWAKKLDQIESSKNYIGKGIEELRKGIKNCERNYPKDFKGMYEKIQSGETHFKKMYAPTVPHLMVYPGMKPIRVANSKRIKLS